MRKLLAHIGVIALAIGLVACSSPSGTTATADSAAMPAAPSVPPPSSVPPSPSPTSAPPTPAPPPATAPPPALTPQAAPPTQAAAPAQPAPAPTSASAVWCRATASVYYAPDDENNVYVYSNQPYTDATASADGYSWSYETNGSGYALIYLNGPPPGTEITVTIGGATCTTSD
jgi:hypothetical protein